MIVKNLKTFALYLRQQKVLVGSLADQGVRNLGSLGFRV